MWSVSQQFLQAIPYPHQIGTQVICTPPGGTATNLTLSSGSVSVSGSQLVRRTADLVVDGGSAIYDLLCTPGARIRVNHGIVWGRQNSELVPVITGELSQAAQQLGDGTVEFNVADLWQKLDAEEYLTDYSPATTATRVSEMTNAVTSAISGCTVTNTSTDTGTVAVQQTWSSRADLVSSFAVDGGTEAFFTPDGNFVIRDEPLITGTPVWAITPDEGGTLTDLQRVRPLDRLYNTIIVTPSSTDGTQTWASVVVQVTDTSDPRHPSKIGVRPYTWGAPTILTSTQAVKAATTLLNRAKGSTETLSLDALSNAALEAGDVVTVTDITDTGDIPGSHLIDSLQLDLISGGMSLATKSASDFPS